MAQPYFCLRNYSWQYQDSSRKTGSGGKHWPGAEALLQKQRQKVMGLRKVERIASVVANKSLVSVCVFLIYKIYAVALRKDTHTPIARSALIQTSPIQFCNWLSSMVMYNDFLSFSL